MGDPAGADWQIEEAGNFQIIIGQLHDIINIVCLERNLAVLVIIGAERDERPRKTSLVVLTGVWNRRYRLTLGLSAPS